MWRIAASLGLMFFAVGWSAAAMVIIFLVVPQLWEALFGTTGGAFGAIVAMVAAIWSSAKIMKLADWLLGEGQSGSGRAAGALAADPDAVTDWQAYSDEITRNKRWAFYRRTRQFERLAALEEDRRRIAARNRIDPAAVDGRPAPATADSRPAATVDGRPSR